MRSILLLLSLATAGCGSATEATRAAVEPASLASATAQYDPTTVSPATIAETISALGYPATVRSPEAEAATLPAEG